MKLTTCIAMLCIYMYIVLGRIKANYFRKYFLKCLVSFCFRKLIELNLPIIQYISIISILLCLPHFLSYFM